MGLETERADRWTLEEIYESSLAASAFIATGEKEFYRCKEVFNLLGLRIPGYGAYVGYPNSDRFYDTEKGIVGTIVYRRPNLLAVAAERLGLIAKAKAPVFESALVKTDDVLQPLLSIPLTENAVLEINPAVERAYKEGGQHISVLRKKLKQQGLLLLNSSAEMVGVISDPAEGVRIPVVGNRRVVVEQKPGLVQEPDVRQARIFGELRQDFAQARQEGRQELFARAFQRCARIAALDRADPERILHPYWTESMPPTLRGQETAEAARNYARQCSMA